MGGGLSSIISYGENPSWDVVHLALSRVKGSKVAQCLLVSKVNLVRTSFKVLFMRSICPELWG